MCACGWVAKPILGEKKLLTRQRENIDRKREGESRRSRNEGNREVGREFMEIMGI